MGNMSYTAHISNKKSAITSKSKLLGVAKHNLRKYKSDDYSKDNIIVLRGTDDLLQDVKNVYHKEFDEASPHVHVVGVPVWEGAKRGLRKKVSKRNVFTPETLSVILQDKLREEAGMCFRYHTHENLSEKSLGRNHDLSVTEYKVAKEKEHLEQIQKQVHDADIELLASQIAYKELERRQTKELNEKTDAIVKKNEAMEREYTDKKEKLESEISYLENKRSIEKSLSDMDKRELQRISNELEGKRLQLQSVN